MANAIFSKGREAFARGDVDWVDDTIKVMLVDTNDVTINPATMQFLSQITPNGARIATATLANKSATNGVLDADDSTFTTATGDQAEALVIYKDTGVEGTSPLLVYIDTATGLPVIPNGGDVRVQWPSDGIATL